MLRAAPSDFLRSLQIGSINRLSRHVLPFWLFCLHPSLLSTLVPSSPPADYILGSVPDGIIIWWKTVIFARFFGFSSYAILRAQAKAPTLFPVFLFRLPRFCSERTTRSLFYKRHLYKGQCWNLAKNKGHGHVGLGKIRDTLKEWLQGYQQKVSCTSSLWAILFFPFSYVVLLLGRVFLYATLPLIIVCWKLAEKIRDT